MIQKKMYSLFQKIRSRPLGMAIAVAAPLMVVLWHLLALAARPAHLGKIVAELGSVMELVNEYLNPSPCPNHACTKLVFLETTENGAGVFFSDAPGRRKLLFEELCGGDDYNLLKESLMGWSPDDAFFAYGRYYKSSDWQIVFCDGNTGAEVAVVRCNEFVAAAAWLSPECLAFANIDGVLYIMRKNNDQWTRPKTFKCFRNASYKPPTEGIVGFTAFDANTVVWRQGGTLFACSEDSDAPVKLWESTNDDTLLEFSLARSKFLARFRDAQGEYFANLYPQKENGRIVGVTVANVTRIHSGEFHFTLINHGEGYAYLTDVGESPCTLVVKPDNSHPPMQFQLQDQVQNFVAGEHAIYVVSSLHDEPSGIWRCDLASGAMECVAPNVEKPFACVRNPRLTTDTITNGAGEPLTYYWLSPTHSAAVTKHPLVIGILGIGQYFAWSVNFEAFANCGAFFVSLDRHQRDSSQWADDAFAVYENLARRPDMDTNKVFLFAESAGAFSVFELLEKNPKLWRGAILFSPSSFPEPSQIPGSRIFMDNCGDDMAFGAEGMKVPMRFQDAAALAGIPVTLIIHPGLGHASSWPVAVRERLREAMIFLNEN